MSSRFNNYSSNSSRPNRRRINNGKIDPQKRGKNQRSENKPSDSLNRYSRSRSGSDWIDRSDTNEYLNRESYSRKRNNDQIKGTKRSRSYDPSDEFQKDKFSPSSFGKERSNYTSNRSRNFGRRFRNTDDSNLDDSHLYNQSSLEEQSFAQPTAMDMLWGRHTSKSALEAGRPLHRIWCTAEIRNSQKFLQLLRDAKSSGVLVEEVSWARLAQITNGAVHQGIAIQTAASETLDLHTLIEGCNLITGTPLLIALDGITDPQNLGAIIRSAEAFGAHGLILPQRRSAGLTGSVAKVAAGALEHLPVARVVNLNRSLEQLKNAGYQIIGLAEEGDVTLSEVQIEGPLVIVTGSEDKGISLVTRRYCDQLVRIPLRGITSSLNASVATALCLYEAARQGWMKDISGQAPSPRIVRAKFSNIDQEIKKSIEPSIEDQSKIEFKPTEPSSDKSEPS